MSDSAQGKDRIKYWLMGISIQGIPLLVGSNEMDTLKEIAEDLPMWSIFVNDPNFKSSVQKEYLVESFNDPVWGTTLLDKAHTH